MSTAVPGLLGELPAFRRTYELPIQRGSDADASDAEVGAGWRYGNSCRVGDRPRTCGTRVVYARHSHVNTLFTHAL